MSYGTPVPPRKRKASPCSTCASAVPAWDSLVPAGDSLANRSVAEPSVAPHSESLARSSRTAAPSRSTKVTCAAPRESDSSPSAPLPANRSRHRAPAIRGASQLKRVSRTRSGVGRIPGEGGNRSFLPRHFPPMIRSTRASLAGREAPGPCVFGAGPLVLGAPESVFRRRVFSGRSKGLHLTREACNKRPLA
jgi:hypothetical protein